MNNATATGTADGQTVTDTDPLFYFGQLEAPVIDLEKLVSVYGGLTFEEADVPPGPTLVAPTVPVFQFVITNPGSVTLTGVTLVDSDFGFIILPNNTIAPGGSISVRVTGSFVLGSHCNAATPRVQEMASPYRIPTRHASIGSRYPAFRSSSRFLSTSVAPS